MTTKQLHYGLIAACVLLVAGLFASVFVGTRLLQSSSEKLQAAKIQREVVDMQEQALISARRDIEEYSDLEAVASRIIPQEKDQARTVREIIAIGERAGVSISNISFPSSNLGNQRPAPAQPNTDETPATPAAIITQAEAVPGLPGLFELNVSVQVSEPTTYTPFISFLEGLERNRRTSQVQSVAIIPDSTDRNKITFRISLAVYLKP